MALTSALYTGLSGLDVNQTQLNVVGNNIANANTVAFKSSVALFKPQFYVTEDAGSAPSADFGGTNPSQLGLGATVDTIETDFSPGALQPTGKDTDMAIDGTGFFVVQGDQQMYTRNGSFNLNSSNQLVNTSGQFVQGFGVDANFNVIPGQLQNVTIPLGTTTTAQATSSVTMQGNLDAAGAVATGASILDSQSLTTVGGAAAPTGASLLTSLASTSDPATQLINVGDVYTLDATKAGRNIPTSTFTVTAGSTVDDLSNFFQQGLAIDTSAPANPNVPAPGVSLFADPNNANGAILSVTGNEGTENALSLAGAAFTSATGAAPLVFSTGANALGQTSAAAGESVHTSFVGYDSLGTPVNVDVTAVLENKSTAGDTWRFYASSGDTAAGNEPLGNGTLTFDGTGKLVASTGTTISVDRSGTGAQSPLVMNLDFSQMTALTSQQSNMVMSQQDGSQIGTLSSFSVGADGTITGAFSNGLTRTLGQLAMATFGNQEGLVDAGNNEYIAGADSGTPVISAPTQLGSGAVRSGTLEQSNVDISKEFVNLIIASTGFSASSRVISTSDQLIQELLQSAH